MAKQFQLLNTTFAQALDRSTSLDISDEVREQVNPTGQLILSNLSLFGFILGLVSLFAICRSI